MSAKKLPCQRCGIPTEGKGGGAGICKDCRAADRVYIRMVSK